MVGIFLTTFYFIDMSRYFIEGKEITKEQAEMVLDNNAKLLNGDFDFAKLMECQFVTVIN